MKKIGFIIFTLLLFSCSRNTRTYYFEPNIVDNEELIINEIEENINYDNIFIEIEIEKNIIYDNILPRIMFVTASNGLRIRSTPTLEGDIIGVSLFGQRLIFDGKTENMVTIDEITDFWYKIRNKDEWLFGGYLSEEFPSEAFVLLGWWDNRRFQQHIVTIEPNYEFTSGFKESEIVLWGTWELDNEILVVNTVFVEIIGLGTEGLVYHEETEYWKFRIIDKNNIIIERPNNVIWELIRSDYY